MKQLVYKFIYNDTINKILRFGNKVLSPVLPNSIKLPPSGIFSIKNADGKSLKLKTNQTNYLTFFVYWHGYTNFEYTNIFIKLIKKISVFYDIGANIGYYSLLAAMENKDIEVVGFEPASGPLYYFRENVKINDFANIKVESCALSDQDTPITFYEIKNKKYNYLKHNLAGESNAGSNTTGRNFVEVQVEATTLDHYVDQFQKDSPIDLIKMDTEGTEHFILQKSNHVLSHMKPIVICETLFDTIEDKLEAIMTSYGYEMYNHTERGLEKVRTIIRKEFDGVSNCFFVHPEKFYLIEEFVFKG